MAKEAIYVGATIAGASDADQYYGPVKTPGTMKKPATIEAHQQNAMNARAEHASLIARRHSSVRVCHALH